MPRVFLGGTCNGSSWRDELIKMLKVEYFNPVLPDIVAWDENARQAELCELNKCDLRLYVITSEHVDFYTIAELTRDAISRPQSTIICLINLYEIGRSIEHVAEMAKSYGVTIVHSLEDAAAWLNKHAFEQLRFDPYIVECLLRDGPTEMYLEGIKYRFDKNRAGHYVCHVQRNDHRKHLCSLFSNRGPDFQIYQSEKLPEPEFTDDELAFIAEWRTMDKDSFRDYVNGRYGKFAAAKDKIKRWAIEKWTALNACDKVPQACPIVIKNASPLSADVVESLGPPPIPEPFDESDTWTDEQWAAWYNSWCRFKTDAFESFVAENEAKILNSPDDIFEKTKDKWDKLLPDKPWPYATGDQGDNE